MTQRDWATEITTAINEVRMNYGSKHIHVEISQLMYDYLTASQPFVEMDTNDRYYGKNSILGYPFTIVDDIGTYRVFVEVISGDK